MISSNRIEPSHQLTAVLDNHHPTDWLDIVNLLEEIKSTKKASIIPAGEDAWKYFAKGTAFITFSYGIDGVSIEISKYAHTLVDLFKPYGKPVIHLIGGNFQPHVSSILNPEWHQTKIDGIDGWDKWDDGKWFQALFKARMQSRKKESNLMTKEIFGQAASIAKRLGKYCVDHQISLLIPVNVASNPGNIALTLGLILVTEVLGLYVLNSNHDYYWEAGKPLSERAPGEKPGVRDHFFRNINNKTFFSLFTYLYPWNGNRWLQLNINERQSRELVNNFGFPENKVFEISTCIADTFFEDYEKEDVRNIRLRMGHILSNGEMIMHPNPIADHLAKIDQWMDKQKPVIIGRRSGLTIDPTSEDLIILLQPTRVVSRKRIPRNLELINALVLESSLREEFINNPNRQIILHITGPTPKEHQADLEAVLTSYEKLIVELPEFLADRIFLAFSVGYEHHASFADSQLSPLTIETIYRMADAVVFPSETEGRGLPILEASASGVPIICSHYHPKKVFREVIGEKLPKDLQIKYILFPEGKFKPAFLSEVANLLLCPDKKQSMIAHNKAAIRIRYGHDSFREKFQQLLNHLIELD